MAGDAWRPFGAGGRSADRRRGLVQSRNSGAADEITTSLLFPAAGGLIAASASGASVTTGAATAQVKRSAVAAGATISGAAATAARLVAAVAVASTITAAAANPSVKRSAVAAGSVVSSGAASAQVIRGARATGSTVTGGAATALSAVPTVLATQVSSDSTTGGTGHSFSHTPAAGTEYVAIIAFIQGESATATSSTIACTYGGSSASLLCDPATQLDADRPLVYIFGFKPAGLSAATIQVTSTATLNSISIAAVDLRNIEVDSPLDVQANTTPGGNAAAGTFNLTTARALDLILGGWTAQGADTDPFVAGAGYTSLATGDSGGGSASIDLGYLVQAKLALTAGTFAFDATWASSDGNSSSAVALRFGQAEVLSAQASGATTTGGAATATVRHQQAAGSTTTGGAAVASVSRGATAAGAATSTGTAFAIGSDVLVLATDVASNSTSGLTSFSHLHVADRHTDYVVILAFVQGQSAVATNATIACTYAGRPAQMLVDADAAVDQDRPLCYIFGAVQGTLDQAMVELTSTAALDSVALALVDLKNVRVWSPLDAAAGTTPGGNAAGGSFDVTTLGDHRYLIGGWTAQGADTDPFTPGVGLSLLATGDAGGGSIVSDLGYLVQGRIAELAGLYSFAATWSSSDGNSGAAAAIIFAQLSPVRAEASGASVTGGIARAAKLEPEAKGSTRTGGGAVASVLIGASAGADGLTTGRAAAFVTRNAIAAGATTTAGQAIAVAGPIQTPPAIEIRARLDPVIQVSARLDPVTDVRCRLNPTISIIFRF